MMFINNKCKFIVCFMLPLILSGCVTQQSAVSGSYYTSEIPQQRISSIASDAAEFLAWKYAPGKTGFDFTYPATKADYFGSALRSGLRLHGFKVSEATGTGLPTRYIIDNDSSGIRVILFVDTATYTKSYALSADSTDLKWTSFNQGAK